MDRKLRFVISLEVKKQQEFEAPSKVQRLSQFSGSDVHPVRFPAPGKTWGETWTHQVSLGSGLWEEDMQVYEPEQFRLILIFQSLDCPSVVQTGGGRNIIVLGNKDGSYQITNTCPPFCLTSLVTSQRCSTIACPPSSTAACCHGIWLPPKVMKYKINSILCWWKQKTRNIIIFLLVQNPLREVAIADCRVFCSKLSL